jgi:sialate O-acetylesterase
MRRLKAASTLLFFGIIVLSISGMNVSASIRLPRVFSSHMVLQQEKPIVIWGWAEPNEKVTIQMSSARAEVTANDKGEWKVVLPPMKASGPFVMTVSGGGSVRFNDVMIGEVWLCSGQSNMEMGIGMVNNAKEEIAGADYSRIRLLMVPNSWTPEPQSDMKETEWKVCSPETIAQGGWGGFSAAAYFFGRELHKTLGVAVGLIDSDWGGTRIESWTPPEGFARVAALKQQSKVVELGNPHSEVHKERLDALLQQVEKWVVDARSAWKSETLVPTMPSYPAELQPPHDVQNPTALYNGMIYPVHPFTIRGAIWYQGESNLGEGRLYADRMRALIVGWRQIWNQGDFPFYFVQIAPFSYGGRAERMGEFWEAQASVPQEVPNTGMAVINDVGDLKDIHPKNKQEVGHRLALLALGKTYGKGKVVFSGPTFRELQVDASSLRVSFGNADGLTTRDRNPPTWFEIIDAQEGGWLKADARIDGSSVVLSSAAAPHPVAVRFAWSTLAEPNLMNSAGLPAGAFRAGKVPARDVLAMYVPEAKDYEVIYELDLSTLGTALQYQTNNAANFTSKFDRVAYCLELHRAGEEPQFVFVSMDAFTEDLKRIGVPTVESSASFQSRVAHMNVYSSAKDIVTGTNLAGGNIEFWPNNYGPANSAKVPNASNDVYDFGDQPVEPRDGYGSMQVHNHDAKQTIFALNHWREGKGADVGIGNQAQGNPDWTFAGNAQSYAVKRLRILVRTK